MERRQDLADANLHSGSEQSGGKGSDCGTITLDEVRLLKLSRYWKMEGCEAAQPPILRICSLGYLLHRDVDIWLDSAAYLCHQDSL